METQELHRGRLIDHIQLAVRDLVVSRTFYDAVLAELKIPLGGEGEGAPGASAIPPRLLRGFRAGSGWQQHRSGVPWAGFPKCSFRADHVLNQRLGL